MIPLRIILAAANIMARIERIIGASLKLTADHKTRDGQNVKITAPIVETFLSKKSRDSLYRSAALKEPKKQLTRIGKNVSPPEINRKSALNIAKFPEVHAKSVFNNFITSPKFCTAEGNITHSCGGAQFPRIISRPKLPQ